MLKIKDKRKFQEAKPTNFTFKGQPVKDENLERSRKRQKVNSSFSAWDFSAGKFELNQIYGTSYSDDVTQLPRQMCITGPPKMTHEHLVITVPRGAIHPGRWFWTSIPHPQHPSQYKI